jgi:hypothetical protein
MARPLPWNRVRNASFTRNVHRCLRHAPDKRVQTMGNTMRKLLWGAAAALAISAPGVAHADTTGHIDLGWENTGLSHNYGNYNSYAIGGAVQTDVTPGWTVQLDGNTMIQQWDHSSADYSHGYAALHADTTLDTFDLGAFVGLQNWYGDGGALVGVEGRTAFDNISLQGSVGYTDFRHYGRFSAWDARIAGNYFLQPNWAINAAIAGTWFNQSGYDTDMTEYSLGTTYQFSHCPMSVSLDYTFSNNDPKGYTKYDGNTVMLGLHWNFGGGTLQDRTNHGASWSGAQALETAFERWDY